MTLTTSVNSKKPFLILQCNISCFKIALLNLFHYDESMENNNSENFAPIWIIGYSAMWKKNLHSTLFYARLMCALLFSLDKYKNYQSTKLQNKINGLSLSFLSQIQQLFRFSFHSLKQIEITYWNFLALFYKPNEQV